MREEGKDKKGKDRNGATRRAEREGKETATVTLKDPHLPPVSMATVATDSRELFSLGHE